MIMLCLYSPSFILDPDYAPKIPARAVIPTVQSAIQEDIKSAKIQEPWLKDYR